MRRKFLTQWIMVRENSTRKCLKDNEFDILNSIIYEESRSKSCLGKEEHLQRNKELK